MKIQFVKDCGHRKAGSVLEAEHLAANQYIAGRFAVAYVAQPVEPEPPAPPTEDPLSEKILSLLVDADVDLYGDDLFLASDEEILSIKGIGKSSLDEIRVFYPEKKSEE